MTTHPSRTLRTARKPREAGPGGGLLVFEVEYGALFRQRVRMNAQSSTHLRSELERSHPEWWPVSIVEVTA